VLILYGLSRWIHVRGELNRKRSLTQQRNHLMEMSPEARGVEDQVSRTGFFVQRQSGDTNALLAGVAVGAALSK